MANLAVKIGRAVLGSTDIASAATTDLGTVDTLRARITGTTTITSFGNAANKMRHITFAAALTLTHDGTSLVLEGGLNITTAAGDSCWAMSNGSGNWSVHGYRRANGHPLTTASATIASASTVNLGSVLAKLIFVSGTTTITSFGSSAPIGAEKIVVFQGALTLTYNATSLIIPGGLSIATAAGDRALVVHEGSGNWRVIEFIRANGHPLVCARVTIASAGTTDLGSTLAQAVAISGTTTITSFGSTAPTGATKEGVFTGALTLTHNATSLILPGGKNIATAAGDTFRAVHEGSGNWRVTSYVRAHGYPLATGVATINAASVIDLGSTLASVVLVNGGTVTITDLSGSGSDLAIVGSVKVVYFNAALTLQHNSTFLVLPGADNIRTAAGDVAVFQCEAAGAWRCVSYLRSFGFSSARNYVDNPSFDVWWRGTTFALAAATETPIANRWRARSSATGRTVSRQAGINGSQYSVQLARDAGNSSTAGYFLGQQCDDRLALQLAGRRVILSLDIQTGADYSGTTLTAIISTGTGTGETMTTSGGFATGNANQTTLFTIAANTTYPRARSAALTIPSNATQIGLRFTPDWSGTAGSNDWVRITNVKLEVGTTPTIWEPTPLDFTERVCEAYYRKSFLAATTPAQNVGSGTGEYRFPATVAGANANRLGTIQFGSKMRAAPTITLFNPNAANAQVRDQTAGADCSASAAGNISDRGFEITCTANAGTTVGGALAIHYVAEADL